MPIKNGSDYLKTLTEDRHISIEGERVKDVASDPRFAGAAQTMADLMEMQSDPNLIDTMTYKSPTTGDKVGMTHIQPNSREDVIARNDAIKVWMDASCGMMGRSPDYKICIISSYASAKEIFKRDAFDGSQNIQNFYSTTNMKKSYISLNTLFTQVNTVRKGLRADPPNIVAS